MNEPARPNESLTPAAVRDSAGVVAWTLGAQAIMQILAMIFARNALGLYALQALAMELVAGKIGVPWSDKSHPQKSNAGIAKRAALGALVAIIAAALCFAAVRIHGGAITKGKSGVGPLALGLFSAALIATRDELLMRGCVIRAFQRVVPTPALLVICGLAAAAGRMSDPTATHVEIAYNAALAIAFASAWVLDRGAWMAIGAHTAWTFATLTLGRGVLFDTKPAGGASFHDDVAVLVVLSAIGLASAAFSALRVRSVNIEAAES